MQLWSATHLVALASIAGLAGAGVWLARGRCAVRVSRGLALCIAVAFVVDHIAAAALGEWSLDRYLPLHLSDVVTIVAVLALWHPRPLLVELTYFWGLTASVQAVLTPNLGDDFPDLLVVTFFVTHGGVVVAALLLVVGRGLVPRAGAVARTFAATLIVAAGAAIGTLATGGNYMFLRDKPPDSLLDLMGPWPWYIASAGLLGLALFALLDTPFRRHR